jgi:hypothetical protein
VGYLANATFIHPLIITATAACFDKQKNQCNLFCRNMKLLMLLAVFLALTANRFGHINHAVDNISPKQMKGN